MRLGNKPSMGRRSAPRSEDPCIYKGVGRTPGTETCHGRIPCRIREGKANCLPFCGNHAPSRKSLIHLKHVSPTRFFAHHTSLTSVGADEIFDHTTDEFFDLTRFGRRTAIKTPETMKSKMMKTIPRNQPSLVPFRLFSVLSLPTSRRTFSAGAHYTHQIARCFFRAKVRYFDCQDGEGDKRSHGRFPWSKRSLTNTRQR
jgi:hypothetical protein